MGCRFTEPSLWSQLLWGSLHWITWGEKPYPGVPSAFWAGPLGWVPSRKQAEHSTHCSLLPDWGFDMNNYLMILLLHLACWMGPALVLNDSFFTLPLSVRIFCHNHTKSNGYTVFGENKDITLFFFFLDSTFLCTGRWEESVETHFPFKGCALSVVNLV